MMKFVLDRAKNSSNTIDIIYFIFLLLAPKLICCFNCDISKTNSKFYKSSQILKNHREKNFDCENENAMENWKKIFINRDKQYGCERPKVKERRDKNNCTCSNISKLELKKFSEHKTNNSLQSIRVKSKSLNDFSSASDDNSESMILLNEGEFIKGTNRENAVLTDYETPARYEYVNKFFLDKFEVSNLDFSLFVLSNDFKTDAELLNSSFVFEGLLSAEQKLKIKNDRYNSNYQVDRQAPWWIELKNVSWWKIADRSIFKLSIEELIKKYNNEINLSDRNFVFFSKWIKQYTNNIEILKHPVTHVSWFDASKYCEWAGKRLPSELEWEYACKYDYKSDIKFPWGQELNLNNTHFANLWQGVFPYKNTEEDGYYSTCSVTSLRKQTISGFKHLIGNVWEWVSDDWSTKRRRSIPKSINLIKEKVKKGGSFLCHKSYCNRYHCSSRSFATQTTTASNLGFRCAKDA